MDVPKYVHYLRKADRKLNPLMGSTSQCSFTTIYIKTHCNNGTHYTNNKWYDQVLQRLIYIHIHIPVRTQLSVIKGMEVSLLQC